MIVDFPMYGNCEGSHRVRENLDVLGNQASKIRSQVK